MRWLPGLALLAFGLGCPRAPAPAKANDKADAPVADKTPEPPAPERPKVEPLTPEEIRLIEADIEELTPDERVKRAYALRKKVMQNPNSPAALMLKDLQEAHENGELELPGKEKKRGMTLYAPGTAPEPDRKSARPPAGYRPPPQGKTEETKSTP